MLRCQCVISPKIVGFRLLAKERLLMLKFSHVLSLIKSLSFGWVPSYNNADVALEISLHIASEF